MAILLICSILGYSLFVSRFHNRLFDAAAPAVACSFLVVMLDIGGILGILKPTVIVLFAAGLLLMLLCLAELVLKKRRVSLRSAPLLCVFIVGVTAIYLYIHRHGSFIYHYDNFSHWGLISRFLVRMDRFPTAENTNIISFTSYPVGSACFIYYVCKVLRDGSSVAMLTGQTLLIFIYYFTLMGCVQKLSENKAFTARYLEFPYKERWPIRAEKRDRVLQLCGFPMLELAIIGGMIAFFCIYNTELNNLLVDNLLAAGGLAATLICMNDADRIEKRVLEVGLVLGALLTIKNSGLFFSLFLLVLFIMTLYDNHERESKLQRKAPKVGGIPAKDASKKKYLTVVVMFLAIPAVLFVLWKVHGSQFKVSKHTMSLSLYLDKVMKMNAKERWGIIDIIMPRMLNLKNNQAILLTLFVCTLALVGYLLKVDAVEMFRCGVFTVFVFFIYECGVLMMYEFSMGYKEVVSGQGNDYFRYNGTIVAVIGGILVNLAMSLRDRIQARTPEKKEIAGIAIACIAALLCYCVMKPRAILFRDKENLAKQYPDWALFETISNDYSFTEDDKVLVRFSQDYRVPQKGSNYFLLPCTDFVNVISSAEMEKHLSEETFDCVIDLVKGTVLRDGVKKQYPPIGKK